MKYWVYINNKVDGPYDENDLATLEGFTPETLICSEEVASKGGQEWVKASSVFEFDEEPAQQSAPTPVAQATAAQPTENTSELLARLDALASGMSNLQSKFEALQSHLDKALEENKKLAKQVAAKQNSDVPLMSGEDDTRANTITLTRHDISSPQTQPEETSSYPQQATPQEDELIIRSALDSIYGGKPLNADKVKEPEEDTFHDLVTGETSADLAREEEEQAVEEIATQLHFTPVEDEQPTQEQAIVENAVITTPSVFEAEKDALINELTSSAKEDVLDQIIAEHQQKEPSQTDAASLAAAGAVAGLAAAALAATPKEENKMPAFEIAPDKENPQQLEEVLPANQLPADVLPPTLNQESVPQEQISVADLPSVAGEPDVAPIAEEKPQEKVDLPVTDLPQELPQTEPVVQEPTELPAMDELVAPAQASKEEQVQELAKPQENVEELVVPTVNEPATLPVDEQPAQEEIMAQEPAVEAEQAPVLQEEQPQSESAITQKDLQDAFGITPDDTQKDEQPTPVQDINALLTEKLENAEGNPNELTEIELKAGSTYLISDFVPPTQVGENKEPVLQPTQINSKKQETIFQDMLAASTIGQSATPLNTDGLPDDISATQINLENTIQAKRGASFDIKTVPMVPEPAQSARLDMNELNDVNAQHDIKKQGPSKSTKWVMRSLIVLLALIVLYVVLGMLRMLPAQVNLFAGKEAPQAQAVQNTQAILQEEANAAAPAPVTPPATPTAQDQALEKVQNFPLPNGYSLKGFIESKHATISPELITWEVADAVEPDNYSVTVKVPPENPQNFKTVYRFNYNMQTGLLDPTISDAKNLLDQAYGINPAQSVATAATTAAPQTATKRATRRATTRKR